MSGKIFISYRRADSRTITDRIGAWLREQFGPNAVFYDIDSIGAGVDWRAHIQEEVGKASVVLAVISERWLPILQDRISDEKDVLRFELKTALDKGIDIVPVLIERTEMPDPGDLPQYLVRLLDFNAVRVHEAIYFFPDMERLANQLVDRWGLERRASSNETIVRHTAANLIVPSGYTGPRQPPPRNDEHWDLIKLPKIAQEQWANGPGGIDRRPSKAVWAKSWPSQSSDLYVRSRSHVVEMTLPDGMVVDCQTEPDPTTMLEFIAMLLRLTQETILNGTSGVCAGPSSSFLVSDGQKIVKFARGHDLIAQVSDEFAWDKMVYRSSKYSENKEALVHSNWQGLTFFDVSSRPYRIMSTADVSLDSRGDLLWSPSLKHLAYYVSFGAEAMIISQSEDGRFSNETNGIFSESGFGAPDSIAWHPSMDILAFTGWDIDQHCVMLAAFDFNTGNYVFKRRLEHTNVAHRLDWSATGRYLATASGDGSVSIWDLKTDKDASLFDQNGEVYRIEFSPDGQRLATFGKAGLVIYNARTGEKSAQWDGSASRESFGESVWSPCGSMIAYSNGALEVRKLTA